VTFYLATSFEGKAFYNSGEGQWISEYANRRIFPSKYQAIQARDVSIFRETITIHEDDDAKEEQQSPDAAE